MDNRPRRYRYTTPLPFARCDGYGERDAGAVEPTPRQGPTAALAVNDVRTTTTKPKFKDPVPPPPPPLPQKSPQRSRPAVARLESVDEEEISSYWSAAAATASTNSYDDDDDVAAASLGSESAETVRHRPPLVDKSGDVGRDGRGSGSGGSGRRGVTDASVQMPMTGPGVNSRSRMEEEEEQLRLDERDRSVVEDSVVVDFDGEQALRRREAVLEPKNKQNHSRGNQDQREFSRRLASVDGRSGTGTSHWTGAPARPGYRETVRDGVPIAMHETSGVWVETVEGVDLTTSNRGQRGMQATDRVIPEQEAEEIRRLETPDPSTARHEYFASTQEHSVDSGYEPSVDSASATRTSAEGWTRDQTTAAAATGGGAVVSKQADLPPDIEAKIEQAAAGIEEMLYSGRPYQKGSARFREFERQLAL